VLTRPDNRCEGTKGVGAIDLTRVGARELALVGATVLTRSVRTLLRLAGARAVASRCECDEGMPRGGRVRACRAHRGAGNWRSDSCRACSVHVFWLQRVTKGALSQRRMWPRVNDYTRGGVRVRDAANFPAASRDRHAACARCTSVRTDYRQLLKPLDGQFACDVRVLRSAQGEVEHEAQTECHEPGVRVQRIEHIRV
jgi:hypothetical protein